MANHDSAPDDLTLAILQYMTPLASRAILFALGLAGSVSVLLLLGAGVVTTVNVGVLVVTRRCAAQDGLR